MKNLFESTPMKIGKHEWRVVVMPSRYSGNCTEYQFRRIGSEYWKSQYDWPGYNINDGTWGGLPHSLRKLHDRHKAELKAWLNGEQQPQGRLVRVWSTFDVKHLESFHAATG